MSIRHWREAGMGCAVAAMVCAVAGGAWGGGSSFGDDDDNSEEVGASYFGFVRDTFGATVPDARVSVGPKDRGVIVTRTDLLGTYKVPGLIVRAYIGYDLAAGETFVDVGHRNTRRI